MAGPIESATPPVSPRRRRYAPPPLTLRAQPDGAPEQRPKRTAGGPTAMGERRRHSGDTGGGSTEARQGPKRRLRRGRRASGPLAMGSVEGRVVAETTGGARRRQAA
ncbi:hypothetical protein GCM10009827_075610 [Dactylosporangium maewongense]|uniref:Uncharacterized protein n=1 Tax=Dactylosporangium maewongense TaxID=634393 RepID=A0ABP4MHQ0_9ACTN